MAHLSNEEVRELARRLATYGKRDTEFPEASPLADADIVAIVQNLENKRTTVGELRSYIGKDYVPKTGGTFTGGISFQGDVNLYRGASSFADVNMNNHKITNLAAPTSDTDAVTKKYVDDKHLWID